MADKLVWSASRDGQVPKDAVNGGWDASTGEPLFVGRAHHGGALIVGKIHPSHRCIYVPFGGGEHKHQDYEALVNPRNQVKLEWIHRKNGNVPNGAVPGGRDSSGEVYYIGRHSHRGDTLPGKVHQSHQCLYVCVGGKEISKKEYNVLVAE